MLNINDTTLASLTVIAGRDRGKTYTLQEDLTKIGRISECQVVLSDPLIEDVHASLANRNGRFAIMTALKGKVAINGVQLPSKQWTWLPGRATITVSKETTLLFSYGLSSTSAEEEQVLVNGPKVLPAPVISSLVKLNTRQSGSKKSDVTKRTEAKFITDRSGQILVRLGEDGHLPELSLSEVTVQKPAKHPIAAAENTVLIYAAFGFSLLASLAIVVMGPVMTNERDESKMFARSVVMRDFVGNEKGTIKPYQQLLRDASLADSRGDTKSEREAYLRVLKLLNSEDKNPYVGVTGNMEDDDRLKKHLSILLRR
jgi:hypothetical protein